MLRYLAWLALALPLHAAELPGLDCSGASGAVVAARGFARVISARSGSFAIGGASGCFVTVPGREVQIAQVGEVFQFNTYDASGPVPATDRYAFITAFVRARMEEARTPCRGEDNTHPASGFTATPYGLCIRLKVLRSLRDAVFVTVSEAGEDYLATWQILVDRGRPVGLGRETWDLKQDYRYDEVVFPGE